MRQTVHYLQIDRDAMLNNRYFKAFISYGGDFVFIHQECLRSMCSESPCNLCAIVIDDTFVDKLAFLMKKESTYIWDVINCIIENKMLIKADSGKYYSNGFMNRVGKHLIANEERSKKQKENALKKKVEQNA